MKKKYIALLVFGCLIMAVYFALFYTKKEFKFIPRSADVVVLVDVKKLTRQYISSFIAHPSQWFGDGTKDENTISLEDSGMQIPDFLHFFHIKNSGFSDWYTVIELKDQQKLLAFLKNKKFVNKGKNLFQKNKFFIKIEGENCLLGTSDLAFETINHQLFQSLERNIFDASEFIDNTLGTVLFMYEDRTPNFTIELKDDGIEIKNRSTSNDFSSLLIDIQKNNHFLDVELDAENIKRYTSFFNKSLVDSSRVNYLKATADLEQVNDTIITYGYDDDFNEIEKKTFQKIIQPNYVIALQTSVPEKTWDYFQHKKWINAQNQFTMIPFQPNQIAQNKDEIIIKSTRKLISLSPKQAQNYIFIKNNALLSSFFNVLNKTEKSILSNIDYIFYGNNDQDYYIKIKAKSEKLPLILRR